MAIPLAPHSSPPIFFIKRSACVCVRACARACVLEVGWRGGGGGGGPRDRPTSYIKLSTDGPAERRIAVVDASSSDGNATI